MEENISVGYINVPDDEAAVDLHSETEGGTVLAKMFHQDPVTVYSIAADWAKISYGGMVGFVELKYLSFTEPTEVIQTTEAQTPEQQTAAAANNSPANIEQNVNVIFISDGDGFQIAEPTYYTDYVSDVRNACAPHSLSTSFHSRMSIAKSGKANMLYYGDTLTVEGSVGEWYYISTDSGNGYDLHGYVKQKYITFGVQSAATRTSKCHTWLRSM